METAEDILKRKRTEDARRSRKYYDNNKEKIAERRKAERIKIRELKKEGEKK